MKIKSLLALAALPWLACLSAHADCPNPQPYGCRDMRNLPPPPGDLEGVSTLRQQVIAAAQSKIGQVMQIKGSDGNKCGWESLTEFYDTAYQHPLRAQDYATLKRPMSIQTVIDVDTGAPAIDEKHPDPKDPHHFLFKLDNAKVNEWCGIFALWAVKSGATSAGTDLAQSLWWKARPNGWGVDGLPFITGYEGIQPGDIAYFRGGLQHQAIVERVVDGMIYTIDGNQQCQQVGRQARDIRKVAGYYRVESAAPGS